MAGEVFEITRSYFQKLAETAEGKQLLAKHDQTIGFEVVGKEQVAEITKRYYSPRFTGTPVVGEERFVIDVKGGKLSFRQGEDVPVPAANWEEFEQHIKVLAERETYFQLYEGKLRPVDALIPEPEKPTRLNIYPFMSKRSHVRWICNLIKLITQQNRG